MSIVDTDSDLTAEQRDAITAMAGHYDHKRGACIEALKYVQSHYRFVSDRHLAEVATLLDMSCADLDGVATYYNLIFRRPVGEHVIFLCDSVSCWIMGRDAVNQRIRARLGIEPGETTPDGAYTLLPIVCLGHCDHAPAMLLDETLHGDLDAARIDTILGIQSER
ncbi:MAG: NADH-quinone oxidoreductase subunit NuoE [Acidiphilium sp.]|nr:NADH-quinone oxidoreductase subunit NuoE [Acidiphilium sp.]MDD4934546.1 NADH-quinone oxidoreductase subunit NuoE [Acidiphilium sp.]